MEKEIKNQETKVVEEGKREDGKKVVKIRRGMKETTRLDHTVPSWMTSEEWFKSGQVTLAAFYMFKKEIFTVYNRRIGFKPYIQEVSGVEAIDIDERKDYELACKLAKTEDVDNE